MDISVVVCTYNPDKRIFGRCLNAIQQLDKEGINYEITIVDNNSSVPVSSLEYVKDFLDKTPCSRIVVEAEQGLTYARICGFRHSTGDLIAFFDDDNEPYPDYLLKAYEIHKSRPFVGIMGPGFIHVDYIDGVDPWIKKHFSRLFQEKNAPQEEYILAITSWGPWYPPGTGQVLKRQVFEKYLDLVSQLKLKTSDRKGKDLSSAGDSQMIWSSIQSNYAVGHHPSLRVNHLIPARRANFDYLARLNYHLELSGRLAYHEMFPNRNDFTHRFRNARFINLFLRIYLNGLLRKSVKSIRVNLASLAGESEAGVKIFQQQMPFLLKVLKRLYKIR